MCTRSGPVIGVPSETKDGERRIALDPGAVARLVDGGNRVLVERTAGDGAGFEDAQYAMAGASLVDVAAEAWSADLVVKVKEPQPDEFVHFRPGLRLFCYLHLAAEPTLAQALVNAGVDAWAFETLEVDGSRPLLAPMSEIAGRVAPIAGAHHLASGSGVLLGGATAVAPGKVVVFGLGVAGTMAARGAKGLDAHVTGVDVRLERLRQASWANEVDATLVAHDPRVADAVADADLVVSAALVPGGRAPIVATSDVIESMRPGSVVVDLAIDQGGSFETSRPTSISESTFLAKDVLHYCVTNMPGQYPRTASRALSAAVAPWVRALASGEERPALQLACNVRDGAIVHDTVADALSA